MSRWEWRYASLVLAIVLMVVGAIVARHGWMNDRPEMLALGALSFGLGMMATTGVRRYKK